MAAEDRSRSRGRGDFEAAGRGDIVCKSDLEELLAEQTKEVAAAASDSTGRVIKVIDERNERRFCALEAHMRQMDDRVAENEFDFDKLRMDVKLLQDKLAIAERSAPGRELIDEEEFDPAINQTIIKVTRAITPSWRSRRCRRRSWSSCWMKPTSMLVMRCWKAQRRVSSLLSNSKGWQPWHPRGRSSFSLLSRRECLQGHVHPDEREPGSVVLQSRQEHEDGQAGNHGQKVRQHH